MHHILWVVLISKEKRNEEGGKGREVAIKKFSDLQKYSQVEDIPELMVDSK